MVRLNVIFKKKLFVKVVSLSGKENDLIQSKIVEEKQLAKKILKFDKKFKKL